MEFEQLVCDFNTHTISNIKDDTPYKIRIRAFNENGFGPYSAPIKLRTLCLPPEPPQLECVSATSTSLKLRWNDTGVGSNREVSYHLQMEDRSGRYEQTNNAANV